MDRANGNAAVLAPSELFTRIVPGLLPAERAIDLGGAVRVRATATELLACKRALPTLRFWHIEGPTDDGWYVVSIEETFAPKGGSSWELPTRAPRHDRQTVINGRVLPKRVR